MEFLPEFCSELIFLRGDETWNLKKVNDSFPLLFFSDHLSTQSVKTQEGYKDSDLLEYCSGFPKHVKQIPIPLPFSLLWPNAVLVFMKGKKKMLTQCQEG